jgi:threonyl-tRNA synthetase
MVKITFPDGSTEEHKDGITPAEIAKMIGQRLFKDALAAKVNDEIVDLNFKIMKDCEIKILTFDHEEGKKIYWHSTAHILAAAVKELYPHALLGIGPAIDEGFYYDFGDLQISQDDLKKIEGKMKEIIEKDLPFEKKEVTKKEAKKIFAHEKYKLELIDEVEGETVTLYKLGDFIDLCKGPHVPSSGKIKVIKLLKLAGAYWKGDSKNPMLQRIYGISFYSQKQLERFLELKRSAEERDHRKIGQKLDLYSFHEEAPGMVFVHPKGMIIWNLLLDFWRKEHRKMGYKEVKTPMVLSKKLWERSGHWDHYKENMYFVKIDDSDFAIKPMNCPGCILVYKTTVHSYKEFPLRISEIGLVHRHELSGVLSGLFRVRCFHQDDAHIFVTPEQIKDEVINIIRLVDKIYKVFGFKYHVELSTRPENAMGSIEIWEKAEKALKDALEYTKMEYKLNPGEGAFYGPKIDFHVKDALGRTWQCGTIQLDFFMPQRFDLKYIGPDNREHVPVMIHRTIYGSLERFIGILVEHYGGAFPVWLSPIQVIIIPVSEKHVSYAEKLKKLLEDNNIRVELDSTTATVEYRIRNAQLQKIPYVLTVGDREVKSNTVAVRTRDGKVRFDVSLDEFLNEILEEIDRKK